VLQGIETAMKPAPAAAIGNKTTQTERPKDQQGPQLMFTAVTDAEKESFHVMGHSQSIAAEVSTLQRCQW
jgi:hypothetical protein